MVWLWVSRRRVWRWRRLVMYRVVSRCASHPSRLLGGSREEWLVG
jgi:hypothetical protein